MTFFQGFQYKDSEGQLGFCLEINIIALTKLTYFQNFNHLNGVNVSLQKIMPYLYISFICPPFCINMGTIFKVNQSSLMFVKSESLILSFLYEKWQRHRMIRQNCFSKKKALWAMRKWALQTAWYSSQVSKPYSPYRLSCLKSSFSAAVLPFTISWIKKITTKTKNKGGIFNSFPRVLKLGMIWGYGYGVWRHGTLPSIWEIHFGLFSSKFLWVF